VQITGTINRENQGNGNGNRTGVRPGGAHGTKDRRESISEAVGGRWPSSRFGEVRELEAHSCKGYPCSRASPLLMCLNPNLLEATK
jgi:hypothetical protein